MTLGALCSLARVDYFNRNRYLRNERFVRVRLSFPVGVAIVEELSAFLLIFWPGWFLEISAGIIKKETIVEIRGGNVGCIPRPACRVVHIDN